MELRAGGVGHCFRKFDKLSLMKMTIQRELSQSNAQTIENFKVSSKMVEIV